MIKKNSWLSIILFTFYGVVFSQEAIPFRAQNEFYIYGDAIIVGNNILSENATQPFNDMSLTNDDIDMVFVDVDDDKSTFSSSSAILKLPDNHTKIKYAVLYWSATYSYEQGFRKESADQFLFQGRRVKNRNSINNIKLKLPGENYKNITGNVIFDGANDSSFRLNSPYVCSADVTKLLKNADTINGEYTVANVTASKGFVSGGSAAGWLLYIVYEAPTLNPKYITTYNGFTHVSDDAVKLKFKNFKALEEGEVSTTLTMAALEGDSALIDDECIIANPILKRASLLSTFSRPRNNFFNSKITFDEDVYNERIPNSENTLGFDVVSIKIPESSQPIVDNNTTEIDLVFNTKADRFYLFFTAFQTEISKTFYEEKQEIISEPIAEINEQKTKKNIAEVKPARIKKEKPEKEAIVETKPKKEKIKKEKPIKEPEVDMVVENEKEEKPKEVIEPKTIVKEEEIKVTATVKPIQKIEEPKVFQPREYVATPDVQYSPKKEEKPLPIWLKKKQEVTVKDDKGVYNPNVNIIQPNYKSNALVLNRDNYSKLLTPEDYVYETQTFKRVLNQEPTLIEGVEKGYYIIANLVSDFDEAITYQNTLKDKGVNSKIFKDLRNEKYYVYLYNSDNFYDIFMLRKAFIKSEFLSEVWILNINISEQILKKI